MSDPPVQTRDAAEQTSVRVLASLFLDALAGWLGGSVISGAATSPQTSTSSSSPPRDLSVADPCTMRGWPVGLFVHTDASLGRYCANDIARRQPSLPRMIADGLLLHDRDGAGDSGAAPPDGS